MTIRILENFWDNFKNNENLIRRCFIHHFNRHPDPEGLEGAYNKLLMNMHRTSIFNRFDMHKIILAAGLSTIFLDDASAEEALAKAGVDINKKWEQFIYKWIEHFVNAEYNKNGKHSKRYVHGEELIDYGIPAEDKTSWIHDNEEATAYEEKFATFTEDRRGRKCYPTHSSRYIAGEEEFDNPVDAIEATELRNKIIGKLTGKNDMRVFSLLAQGLSEKEISQELNFTQQYTFSVIKKIRKVTEQLCEVQKG